MLKEALSLPTFDRYTKLLKTFKPLSPNNEPKAIELVRIAKDSTMEAST